MHAVENVLSSSSSKPAATSKPVGSTARGSGLDAVPAKYDRKPISKEEMEYIEVCNKNGLYLFIKLRILKHSKSSVKWLQKAHKR